jgi:hypothetical protein
MWAAVAVAAAVAILLVVARSRGALARAAALALFVLALANPSITREDRDPLTSVAAVVVDRSASQEFSDRTKQTEAVRAELAERLARIPGLEVRFVEAGQADARSSRNGLRAYPVWKCALWKPAKPTERPTARGYLRRYRLH